MNIESHIGFKIDEHKLKNVRPSHANHISLLDPIYHYNFLDKMPKNFTITTNNGSSKFNVELLKDTSSVISELIANNPDETKLDLQIDDETNILSKFEKLYQGQSVLFNKEDAAVYEKINDALNIENIPDINNINSSSFNIVMRKRRFHNYLKENAPRTFKIKTRKNEYNCNIFGILYSKAIQELISKNPIKDQYLLNFEDKCDEFKSVCDILNFKEVKITTNNMKDLKKIFTNLQMDPILNSIDRYIQNFEEFSQIIDRNQELIDSIEELFDNLYNIKEKTVEKVKDFIVNSFWSKTEKDVQELAAFIIQAERSDIHLHHKLIELIIKLDKEAKDSNKLDVLKPFIVSKFTSNIGESLTNCSFLYNLYKNEFISKEEILNLLKRILLNGTNSTTLSNLLTWFLPEITEIQSNNMNQMRSYIEICNIKYLLPYLNNGFDEYNEARNSGEPNNEITKAIFHDDVDTLKELVIKNRIDISKALIPCNIYSQKDRNGRTNYIDCAAKFGSLKCFKYLFLNHEKVDKLTFDYAISGGNYEIIKIVDQNALPNNHVQYKRKTKNMPQNQFSDIVPSIRKHKYNLFDWILEHKYTKNNIYGDSLNELVKISMLNGNAHSLIEIIDKGYSFVINSSSNASVQYTYQDMLESSARKGFYRLTKLLYNIITEKAKGLKIQNGSIFLQFGNFSIFQLLSDILDTNELGECFIKAVEKINVKLLDFIFSVMEKKGYKLTPNKVISSLDKAILMGKNDFFNYITKKFQISNPEIFDQINWTSQILPHACEKKNLEAVKTIVDLCQNRKQQPQDNTNIGLRRIITENDFTNSFIKAMIAGSNEICKYLIDKQVLIDFNQIPSDILSSLNVEMFSLIANRSTETVKEKFYNDMLYPAIKRNNKNLVKYLLNGEFEFKNDSQSLLMAVNTRDLEMVDIIIKYNSKPSFINKNGINGTALLQAVENNDIQVVKHLLSIKGINPRLYNKNLETPLIKAIKNMNFEIFDSILDFYGDKINQNEVNAITQKLLNYLPPKQQTFSCFNPMSEDKRKKLLNAVNRIIKIDSFDPNIIYNNNSLLTYAIMNNETELVQNLLKNEKTDLNIYVPDNGNTPLILAIKQNNLKMAELLINDPRIDINMENYLGETPFMIAITNGRYSIISSLLKNEKFEENANDINYLFSTGNIKLAKQIISSKYIDVNSIFDKPLQKFSNIVNYNHDMNINRGFSWCSQNSFCSNGFNKSRLVWSAENNDEEMIDLIINHPTFDQEKSNIRKALFIAYKKNSRKIYEKLSNIIKNISNYEENGQNMFQLACLRKDTQLIEKILNNPKLDSKTIDVLTEFNNLYINTFGKPSDEEKLLNLIKILYKYDQEHDHLIDFNKLLPNGKSFFTAISKESEKIDEFVKFYLSNGADPNIKDELGIIPLQYAISINSRQFAELLIETNKIDFSLKVTNMGSNEQSLFESISIDCDEELINKILSNPSFDSKKQNMIDIFCNYFKPKDKFIFINHKIPVKKLSTLYNYDKEHDKVIDLNKLLPNKKSFFTAIPFHTNNIEEVVKFLLENGADPNIVDGDEFYPLEYAISTNNDKFVHALIESNKIDFSKKLKNKDLFGDKSKYKTYLHIAARSINSKILNEFLQKKLIDVNVTDDLNQTPFMEASKFGILQNCKMISEKDYLELINKRVNESASSEDEELSSENKSIIDSMETIVTDFQPGKYVPFWKKSQDIHMKKKRKTTNLWLHHANEYKTISIYNYSWDSFDTIEKAWNSINPSGFLHSDVSQSKPSAWDNISVKSIWEQNFLFSSSNKECVFNTAPLLKRIVKPYKTWNYPVTSFSKLNEITWDFSQKEIIKEEVNVVQSQPPVNSFQIRENNGCCIY